jgi:hypothetical protein
MKSFSLIFDDGVYFDLFVDGFVGRMRGCIQLVFQSIISSFEVTSILAIKTEKC